MENQHGHIWKSYLEDQKLQKRFKNALSEVNTQMEFPAIPKIPPRNFYNNQQITPARIVSPRKINHSTKPVKFLRIKQLIYKLKMRLKYRNNEDSWLL